MTKDLNEEIIDRAVDGLGAVSTSVANYIKNNVSIVGLTSSGSNYKITVKYPAPVTSKSLTIKSFTVVDKDKDIMCPGQVMFAASIKTDYTMSGQVWLENENGTTTKKLSWSNPKNQTNLSFLKRTRSKPVNVTHHGWSRRAISFKDVLGNTHVKKSAISTFTRTCEFGLVWQ